MNHKVVGLLVLCISLFSYITSWAGIAEELKKLRNEQSKILDDVKERAGGDSTMTYRVLKKNMQPKLDEISRKIGELERVQELIEVSLEPRSKL